MEDIWKLGKHCIWSGIVNSDHNCITCGDFLHWKQKEQVRLLKCIWTVCCLANFVYGLLKRMVQMVRWVGWYSLSSTDLNNIGQTWKITCYV